MIFEEIFGIFTRFGGVVGFLVFGAQKVGSNVVFAKVGFLTVRAGLFRAHDDLIITY